MLNVPAETWNNKILDYEIETWVIEPGIIAKTSRLETIRFSITRLKLKAVDFLDAPDCPWNNKILDYEIETAIC